MEIDLMAPRWKVIADYPGTDLPIDTIIEYDKEAAWVKLNGDFLTTKRITAGAMSSYWFSNILEIDKYPHLFKKLKWFEDRTADEFPEYIKRESGKVFKIYNKKMVSPKLVGKYGGIDIQDAERTGFNSWISFHSCLPATLQEYTDYLNTQKI